MIHLSDESHVPMPRVKDFVGGRYVWVPEDHLRVLPMAGDNRRLAVEYRTQLQRRPYIIRVQGVDLDGSVRNLDIVIPLAVGFFEEASESWVPLEDGAAIADSTRLIVTIHTGTHLLPDHDVHLRASGISLSLLDALTLTEEDQLFRHTLWFGDIEKLPPGPTTLELRIRQPGEQLETVAVLDVVIGEAQRILAHHYWIPNPFDEETTMIYELNRSASRVRLRIFTISGRHILTNETLPGHKGTRTFVWDGRDEDGHPVANGLYFAELSLWGAGDRKADSVLDKVVRAR